MSQFMLRAKARLTRLVSNKEIRVTGEFKKGRHVTLGEGVRIHAENLYLGDCVSIEPYTVIDAQDLYIGDYTRIKRNCFISGTDWCYLGANCWIGHFAIIDSIGTTYMGNGSSLGAHGQFCSHFRFGDTLKGAKFNAKKPLRIGDDVWITGHCLSYPVRAEDMSVALAGSIITKDMKTGCIYGGVPAQDITDKLGAPFIVTEAAERKQKMLEHLDDFEKMNPQHAGKIEILDHGGEGMGIWFDVRNMLYAKTLQPAELAFMQYLLPYRAKFVPMPERNWVREAFLQKHGSEV